MNTGEEQKRWRKREEKLLHEMNGRSQEKEKHKYFVPVLDSDTPQRSSDHQQSRIVLPEIDQCQLKRHPNGKPVQQHRESKAPRPKEDRTDFEPSLGEQPEQKQRFFEGLRLPMSPAGALEAFGHLLTKFERQEILHYSEIWYLGLQSPKINGSKSSPQNNGYDDSEMCYLQVPHDHIAYRFEVLEVLGRGSYAQVLKCWDHKEEELVAIKLLKNEEWFYGFGKKEIEILEALQKDKMNIDSVVHMKDHFCFREHLCITFELLGITLQEKNRGNKRLSTSEVRKYATSLLKCLSLLTKEKIIHCDLKPRNIVLSNENPDSLKVIDFGTCRYEEEAIANSYIQPVTYRAPEVILGHVCSVAIDMWSLGCIIFEVCTGQKLFQGNGKEAQLYFMIEALGMPPQDFLASAPDKNIFFDSKGMLKQNSKKKIKLSIRADLASRLRTKEPHLLDFIKRCLEWDPNKRMTPDEAMQHPWILQHKESSRSKFSLKRQVTTTNVARNSFVGMEANLLSRRKLSPARLPQLEATKKAQVQQKADRAEVSDVVLRPSTTNRNRVIRLQIPQIPQAEGASVGSFRPSKPMSGRPNRMAREMKRQTDPLPSSTRVEQPNFPLLPNTAEVPVTPVKTSQAGNPRKDGATKRKTHLTSREPSLRLRFPQIPQAEGASVGSFQPSRPMSGRPNGMVSEMKHQADLLPSSARVKQPNLPILPNTAEVRVTPVKTSQAGSARKDGATKRKTHLTSREPSLRLRFPQIPQAEGASVGSFKPSRPMSGRPNGMVSEMKHQADLLPSSARVKQPNLPLLPNTAEVPVMPIKTSQAGSARKDGATKRKTHLTSRESSLQTKNLRTEKEQDGAASHHKKPQTI